MAQSKFHLLGSFQRGMHLDAENPIAEVSTWLEHTGLLESLQRMTPCNTELDWTAHCEYASIRMRQSAEFRVAARASSTLTAPVLAYYGMLNLLRAVMAIVPEIIPSSRHGLKYISGTDLFDSGARLCSGTFKDYLVAVGAETDWSIVRFIDCVRMIPELVNEVGNSTQAPTFIAPVLVRVTASGEATLSFNAGVLKDIDFQNSWKTVFPSLADCCVLDSSAPHSLTTRIELSGTPIEKPISEFCEHHFVSDLRLLDTARWYALRRIPNVPQLPREGAYFAAMFVLSSVARYEPERLKRAMGLCSEPEWLLRRFLAASDRYFPQLMLSRVVGEFILT